MEALFFISEKANEIAMILKISQCAMFFLKLSVILFHCSFFICFIESNTCLFLGGQSIKPSQYIRVLNHMIFMICKAYGLSKTRFIGAEVGGWGLSPIQGYANAISGNYSIKKLAWIKRSRSLSQK